MFAFVLFLAKHVCLKYLNKNYFIAYETRQNAKILANKKELNVIITPIL